MKYVLSMVLTVCIVVVALAAETPPSSITAINPSTGSTSALDKIAKYHSFYGVDDALSKLTDIKGKGRSDLYGTRNFRVILHGVAYRGGGNNYYHKTAPRDNKNPLPQEGIENLVNEGFSKSVYLYTTNFDSTNTVFVSDTKQDTLNYYQIGGNTPEERDSIMAWAYAAITNKEVGPVYYHCWNGWHQSGFVSAILLKQYCGYDSDKSIHYWEDATDNWNRGYDRIRDAIRAFEPLPQFKISPEMSNAICPDYEDLRSEDALVNNKSQLELLQTVLLFPSSSAKLPPSISTFLDEYAAILQAAPFVKIAIVGHSDSRGKASTNYKLSYNRAKSVYRYLVAQGVEPTMLSYEGKGESELVNRCKDGVKCSDDQHSANRRVAFKIESISLHIRYGVNSTQVPQSDKETLRNMFALISSDKDLAIEIQGYSSRDSVEASRVEKNRMVNQNVSERRAHNILEFLRSSGFDMSSVRSKGYGYTDDMEYNNESDRRIEFKIMPKDSLQ